MRCLWIWENPKPDLSHSTFQSLFLHLVLFDAPAQWSWRTECSTHWNLNRKLCRPLSCRQLCPVVYSLDLGLHRRWPPASAGGYGSSDLVLCRTFKHDPRAALGTHAVLFNSKTRRKQCTATDIARQWEHKKPFCRQSDCEITPTITAHFQMLDCNLVSCFVKLQWSFDCNFWHPAGFPSKPCIYTRKLFSV